jgi:hypothetical protein
MQSSLHFRHQAETCLRLAASCTDQSLANSFQAMAENFIAKAARVEVRDKSEPVRVQHPTKYDGLSDLN